VGRDDFDDRAGELGLEVVVRSRLFDRILVTVRGGDAIIMTAVKRCVVGLMSCSDQIEKKGCISLVFRKVLRKS